MVEKYKIWMQSPTQDYTAREQDMKRLLELDAERFKKLESDRVKLLKGRKSIVGKCDTNEKEIKDFL